MMKCAFEVRASLISRTKLRRRNTLAILVKLLHITLAQIAALNGLWDRLTVRDGEAKDPGTQARRSAYFVETPWRARSSASTPFSASSGVSCTTSSRSSAVGFAPASPAAGSLGDGRRRGRGSRCQVVSFVISGAQR